MNNIFKGKTFFILITFSLIMFIIGKFDINLDPPKVKYYDPTLAAIDVSKDPEQTECLSCKPIFEEIMDYTLLPVANYTICGKVIDKVTFLRQGLPDIGLIWGEMAEPKYDKYIDCSSSNGILSFRFKDVSVLPQNFNVGSHMSNNHIIPSNKNIMKAINSIKIKEKICMQGYLVNASYNNKIVKKTSLSRTDNGIGACELFYVKIIRIGNNFYE